MSTFSGLSTALSGLWATRQSMDVTGHNIANANTPGYSKERVNLASVAGSTIPSRWSSSNPTGSGVQVVSVDRLHDALLERRAVTEHGNLAYASTTSDVMSNLEGVLQEPSDNGLQSQLSSFWSAWSDVANHPGDTSSRAVVLQDAQSLSNSLNQVQGQLVDQWKGQREALGTLVSSVNATAAHIGQLNDAIRRSGDVPPNDLLDQRDTLVRQLADQVGASAHPNKDGTEDIYIGGSAIVTGSTVKSLAITGPSSVSGFVPPPTTAVQVVWASDGSAMNSTTGEVAARQAALNTTIPTFAGKMAAIAQQLATDVNTVHRAGFGLDGSTNLDLFSVGADGSLSVAITDPKQLGASNTAGTLDGSNATAMSALAQSTGSVDVAYRALVVDIGAQTQGAATRADIQTTVTQTADDARDSATGVDMDQEMTDLVMQQHAYDSAAKLMSVIDGTLDTLINHTGL